MQKSSPLHPLIDIAALNAVSEHAAAVVHQVRTSMLAPHARKSPPTFNSAQMAELCGLEVSQVQYLAKKGELPSGDKPDSNRREWTLVEARRWVRTLKADNLRDPMLAAGVCISVANFKGGVSKTTTAAVLAQGLSLRGHNVLVIDTDPQGSLTTLFGVMPDTEVEEDQTILSLCSGETDSIMPAVRQTYWDGIDLVAAAPVLFNAEFLLPARQKSEPDFAFWRVLDAGLDSAREIYDVIIIDTPPSLSYITINALIAAEGIVMPLPPNALDFASSAQFWNLFTEVCGGLFRSRGDNKKYYFVDVVLSRVDRSDAVSAAVREWIISAYGSKVLPIEIPKTSIAATASAEFGTVYDLDASSAQAKTLKRARDAYDQLVEYIELQVMGVWASNAEAMLKLQAKVAIEKVKS
ncbi:ParA family protein [Polaromonas sp. CG_9.11]|uniref:ParA family protein n=1 Tax=Polaromonas sp. CG_9.11 TaxID=2787730 RepID=UPI0018CB40C3|nr:AAA family ATPase [Polaromonas sp. CG_9.11]MBG6078196.1 chromosome partitioning protein [Polaromonas sp. CG_9.11]